MWTGHQARERGLVDEIGGLDRAIELAKEKAKLDVTKAVDLLVYPQKPSFYDLLANPLGTSTVAGLELFLPRADARAVAATASTLSRFRRGESLLLMPNVFVR